MNARQRRFAETYAACGNAAQAARKAGYSEATARSQGQRLLTNADVVQLVKALQDADANARVVSIAQIKAFWSDVLNDANAKTADRLKASELLAKSAGAFLRPEPEPAEPCADVVIYLPENDRDPMERYYENNVK